MKRVTARVTIPKIFESAIAENMPKIDIEPICSGISALADSIATSDTFKEMVYRLPQR